MKSAPVKTRTATASRQAAKLRNRTGSAPTSATIFRALAEISGTPKSSNRLGKPRAREADVKARPPAPATGVFPDSGVRANLWQLRLYVTGQTSKSLTAFSNLKKFCDQYLKGRYRIKVIDLVKEPHLAKGDQILAIPTVVRRLPKPVRTIIGNLSEVERVLVGLDLRAADPL